MKISARSHKRTHACQLPNLRRKCFGAVKYVYDSRLCWRHRVILKSIVADAAKAERKAAA